MRRERRSGIGDALMGLAAGLAASWVMERAQSPIRKLGTEESLRREREASARQGEPATEKAAEAVARPLGIPLDEQRKGLAGELVHYGTGAGWGLVYALAARRLRLLRLPPLLAGLAFGALVFAVTDELMVPLLGWAGGPGSYPASTHAKALAAHLVYGASTAGAWRALDGAFSGSR